MWGNVIIINVPSLYIPVFKYIICRSTCIIYNAACENILSRGRREFSPLLSRGSLLLKLCRISFDRALSNTETTMANEKITRGSCNILALISSRSTIIKYYVSGRNVAVIVGHQLLTFKYEKPLVRRFAQLSPFRV